jgi:hypothetical protein
MGKIFENLFKKPQSQKVQIFLQGDLMAIKKSTCNFACVYMGNISQYESGERCGPWASCCNYLPFEEDMALYLNNLEFPLPKEDSHQV